ncbi:hypothetical protein HPB49_005823 [Dermacentor silvarum]|uniref:Uncharacterized protein n=1 Tax=Dermacentor silvarum TaxID=543639 RepID=A0ACB8CDH6_DERSI|nr:hypothetical protein HPB49_005823 [Dermacentor silvarum]
MIQIPGRSSQQRARKPRRRAIVAEKVKRPQQKDEADGPPPRATKNAPDDDDRAGQAGNKSRSSPRADFQQHQEGGRSPLKGKKAVAADNRRAHAGRKSLSSPDAKVHSVKVPCPKPQQKRGDSFQASTRFLQAIVWNNALRRQLLEDQLDKTIDACEDFGAYVCRRWLPRKEFAELSRSMLSDMVLSWLSRLPDTLTKSAARLPVGRKAAAMFNSCLTQFMHDHGLAWPEFPDGSIKPLEALFDLSFNWRVHLWLRLNVLAVTRHYNRRLITVSPNDILALWWQVFRQIPKQRFDTVYQAFFKMFAKNTTIRPRTEDINKIKKGLEIIFETFLPGGKWNARSPNLLSLRELDSHSSVAIGEQLMHNLNSALRIDPPVTMEDLVLLSDDAILEGTFGLISNYSDRDVLQHLSWLFMQACAVVADPAKVLVVLHGNKHHAVEQLPRFCARQVEDSYNPMVSAMASVAHFAVDERRSIDDFLAEIRQMALNKTLAATWLDNATSKLAADKLKNVEAVLWPAKKFLTTRALGEVYAHFPETGAWFANFWIESRRSQRGLFGSEAGVEEQRIRDSMAPPYIEFVHGLNKLSLSIGALAPPLYYPNGTNAMLYGGLGNFYAKGLLEAIDDDGVRVGPFFGNFCVFDLHDGSPPGLTFR